MNRPMIVVEDRETGAYSPTRARRRDQVASGSSDTSEKISKRWATVAPASSSSVTKRIP